MADRNDVANWSPAPVADPCDSCTSFYTYAQLSEQLKLELTHFGVVVLQYQQGQPTDATGYVPMDLTTGLIAPVINDIRVPDVDLDVPGRVGGRALDFGNSLTRPGDGTNYRSAPMGVVVAAPNMSVTVNADTTIDYDNIRNEDRGETASVELVIVPPSTPVSLIENLASLVAISGTFSYTTDGLTWTPVTPTRRWDGATVFSFNITLDNDSEGQLQFRSNFDAASATGDYTMEVQFKKADARGDVKPMFAVASDTFTLS